MNNPNILSFAFVDTTLFAATMALKYGKNFESDWALHDPLFQDCKHIFLRGPATGMQLRDADSPSSDYSMMSDWPSAHALLDDVRARIIQYSGNKDLVLGNAYVESLQPGGFIGWHVDDTPYAKQHTRFRLLASPCSGGSWFCGNEAIMPGVGNLTFINHNILHSAINLGPVPQISLVVDVRRAALQ